MRAGALLLAVAAVGAAGGGLWLALRERDGGVAADFADASIGAVRLVYPAALARAGAGRRGGALEALDLAATWPGLQPVPQRRPGVPEPALVFVSLRPQSAAIDPAERPVKLYARFFSPEVWSEPGGLVMRRFEPGSPYAREELFMAPPEGRAFAARCSRPAQPADGLSETCFSEMWIKGLDVQVRFSPALLPEWEAVQGGARRLVEGMVR